MNLPGAEFFTATAIELAERGWLPDALLRRGMRRLCARRLADQAGQSDEALEVRDEVFAADCRRQPIAPLAHKANEQHYEVPAEFYRWVLGPRRKYSSCYWTPDSRTLAEAEEAALELTCRHAEIEDGLSVLELGCGWGSLTLWLLEHYPRLRVTAVSNSASQRTYIEGEAHRQGFAGRLRVLTADMNVLEAAERFDRVVSVEMFEHMRNYQRLLARIAEWLEPEGKLLVHIFCHRRLSYAFEADGAANWMGRYFFSGGIMPSARLLGRFDRDLAIEREWTWNGAHYARTAEAWVANMDRQREALLPVLANIYGASDARRWFHRWRMLFLAGAELFGYANGDEWFVQHYRFTPVRRRAAAPPQATAGSARR